MSNLPPDLAAIETGIAAYAAALALLLLFILVGDAVERRRRQNDPVEKLLRRKPH